MYLTHEQIGFISFCIVTASILPYAWNILIGRSHTSITGWLIGTLTGFVTYLTYGGIGAAGNMWIAAIELVDPALILVVAIIHHHHNKLDSLERHDKITIVLGFLALLIHVLANNVGAAQLAYTAAIAADICSAWAVVRFAWRHPAKEQPFPWWVSILGVSLSFFSIEHFTIAQVSLPIYQLVFCFLVFFPAARHRLQNRVPLRQW